jgi:alpha-galactosidase
MALMLVVAERSVQADYTNALSALDISQLDQDSGTPQANLSVSSHPLCIGGRIFTNGVGTRAPSRFILELNRQNGSFSAMVGIDDEAIKAKGKVVFKVMGDGRLLWESKAVRRGDSAERVSVALTNVQRLTLLAEGDSAPADWVDAKLVFLNPQPTPAAVPSRKEEAIILTPKPSAKPRLNSPQLFGVRPGAPFRYTLAATGERPMSFAAEGLPAGLELDAQTGIVTGSLDRPGEYEVRLQAHNRLGAAARKLKIVCGPQIGLTPAMGWNSWNCFAGAVSADQVKSAADAMVASGLINHGWTYINIDDFWQGHRDSKDPTLQGPKRDTNGVILPNARFPDLKGLADYIHSKGLKAGIYSSPGPWTCGGCVGSFDHEETDARAYARWGFDYLKYDLCSYRPKWEKQRTRAVDFAPMKRFLTNGSPMSLVEQVRPYAVMRAALNSVNRDILFSFCQYGRAEVWEWGAEIGGNSWRTTGDIVDLWADREGSYQGSVSGIGFSQTNNARYAGPGHFNDPDMLVVGKVGWGPSLHPTRLTPNEQYSHLSLWCLLAAPLLIGCDMTQMDEFTLSLLTNDEVLEVDQDPLGRQATRVRQEGGREVWAKDMEDGSKAVGLFNRGYRETAIRVKWSDLGVSGRQAVRDLWRQKDLGKVNGEFEAQVPRHGVVLVRIGK